MKIWKNIAVAKASDGGLESKLPTHRLTAVDENYQHRIDVGSFWTKEGAYGKFLSGVMNSNKTYKDKDGNDVAVVGYVIVREDELNELINGKQSTLADIGEVKEKVDFTPNVNEIIDEIPF